MQKPKIFYGHTLLQNRIVLALLCFIASSIAFAAFADEVREGDTLRFDQSILRYINGLSNSSADQFFVFTTNFGGVFGVIAFTAILIGLLVYRKRYLKASVVLAIVGGAALANLVLKTMFERARPELWERLVVETSFSFPSGHAMGSSALAFALVAVMWNTRWRVHGIVIAALYIPLIGLSRMYLGVHYPTDVAAGWFLSAVWAITVVIVTNIYHRQHPVALDSKDERLTRE